MLSVGAQHLSPDPSGLVPPTDQSQQQQQPIQQSFQQLCLSVDAMIDVVDEDDDTNTDLGLDMSSGDNGSTPVNVGTTAGADRALGASGEDADRASGEDADRVLSIVDPDALNESLDRFLDCLQGED